MTEKKLLELNQRGIFPLPGEGKEAFIKRAEKLKGRDRKMPLVLQKYYDANPDWLQVSYSDANLYPWEAACSLYSDDAVEVELRGSFQKKEKYLWYSQEEVLAHECVHAIRAPLKSEKYEEIFAYFLSISKSRFRAVLGPIFSKVGEVFVFLISCFLPLLSFFFEGPFTLIPLIVFAFFLSRLFWRWHKWLKCAKKIPLPLMCRLTDGEIDQFAKMSKEKIAEWIVKEKNSSFRWQLLTEAYCKE